MNKLPLFLVVCFLFISFLCIAQQDFIINLNGDTLFGKVKLTTRTQKLTFKTKKDKVHFYPHTALSFGRYNKTNQAYDVYQSVRIQKQEKAFLKVLVRGKLQLFERRKVFGGNRSVAINTCYFVGRTVESLQLIAPFYYEGIMNHYLKEIPQISQKLQKATFYEIPELVEEFNQVVK